MEEAAASLATATKRRSASALAAMSRRTALNGRKKDEVGAGEDGGKRADASVCAGPGSRKPTPVTHSNFFSRVAPSE
jgi:hypothetical protein